MDKVKSIALGLVGLAISLALLMVVLRVMKKVPVIGGAVGHVQNLVQEGQL